MTSSSYKSTSASRGSQAASFLAESYSVNQRSEYSENRRTAELEYAKHLDFQLRTNNQALNVVLKINQELREDAESLKNDYDENVNALLKLKEENTSLKDKNASLQDQNAKGIQIQLKNNTKAKEDNHKMSEEISKLKKEISELTEKTITKQTEDDTKLQSIEKLEKTINFINPGKKGC